MPLQFFGLRRDTTALVPLRISSFAIATALFLSGAVLAPLSPGSAAEASAQNSKQTEAQNSEPTSSTPQSLEGNRFSCQFVDGEYTVMYSPQSQPDQTYAWAKPAQLGGGWTPERRCSEISRRLESYRPDGLQEMRTGMENGYNVVCVTTQQNPGCRIVLTVPPGQDPTVTRDRVFENLTVADNGQQTEAVATFQGDDQDGLWGQIGEALNLNLPSSNHHSSSRNINLRPFLDQADGGTGLRLRRGTANHGYQLNPDQFR